MKIINFKKSIKVIFSSLLLFSFIISMSFGNVKAADELTIWYIDNNNVDDTLLDLIDNFESSNSITVNAISMTHDELKSDYIAKYASINGPDLIQGSADWIAEFAMLNTIQDINSTFFIEDYMMKARRAISYYKVENYVVSSDIVYYGFPQYVDTVGYLYNTEKVTASVSIPSYDGTWDLEAFKSAVSAMNDQSDPNPDNKKYGFSFMDLPYGPNALFFGGGGLYFTDLIMDGSHNEVLSNQSLDAMEYVYDLVNTYKLSIDYSEQGTNKTFSHFAEVGNVASTLSLASDLKYLLNGSQFSDPSKLGVAPAPMDEIGQYAPIEVTALMINSQSSNTDNAIKLAQALSSKNAMIENAKNEYLLPAIESAYDDENIMNNRFIQAFKEYIDQASIKPISQYTSIVKAAEIVQLNNMLEGKQNGLSTCTGLNLLFSSSLPINANIDPIPLEGESAISGANSILIIGIIGLTSMLIFFTKKRKMRV
jgi:ABC-type glycerol-3-phosphate transport system substrate-binding protein